MVGDATACSTRRTGPSSPNRIDTPFPAWASASVEAMWVCSAAGPEAVGTVLPSIPFSRSRTDGYATSANLSSIAC